MLDKLEEFLNPAAAWTWIKANWQYILAGLGGVIALIVLLKVTYRRRKTPGSYKVEETMPLIDAAKRGPRVIETTAWFHPTLGRADAEILLQNGVFYVI